VCGDTIIESGEQCDDGNTTNGDGCDNSCQLETPQCSDFNFMVNPETGDTSTSRTATYAPTSGFVVVELDR
jgi:cysteine-rich repeat protein